jgi:hypothetical protein
VTEKNESTERALLDDRLFFTGQRLALKTHNKHLTDLFFERCHAELLGSSLVNRPKGRVVESAGIRFHRKRSGPDRWHKRPWSGLGCGRQDTDPLPAFGTARPLGFEELQLSRYL